MSTFNLFGNTNTAAGSNTQGTTPNTGGLFGKPPNTTQPTGGLFGNTAPSTAPAPSGPGLFGFGNPTNTTTNAATSSTPAAVPAANTLFGNTTTTPAPTGGLFGGGPTTTPTATSNTTQAAPAAGLFSGFGQSKPADQTAPKPATSSFFAAPNTNAGATSTTPAPAPSLFGSAPVSTSTTAAGTSGSTPAAAAPATGGGLFGGGLFGKKPETPATGISALAAPGTTGATGTTGSAPSLFGGLAGATTGSTATPAAGSSATTSTSTPSLFGTTTSSTNKPEEKKDGAAPATTFNLFGASSANKPEPPKLGASAASTSASTTATSTQVSVPAPSMLRGKSLDEIVNKWTTELEGHVKQFGTYATDVAVWDRALVESGNNISALYATLLAAEREQSDIDQSLEHIEQQQSELAATLDAYEKVTDEILGSSNVPSQGGSGGLRSLDTGPADTERDRNYMLATELHGHLDDLSVSLTQMIESVNALSPNSTSNLSNSTAESALTTSQNGPSNDDPLTQIAQVLANHLESLQWIDGAVREVETKVVDVERRVRGAAGDATALGAGSVGPAAGVRGSWGIGVDYNVRFGSSDR